jgi:carbonic anhydrase/acetyltransferase-like protein (isoleucine patch superfamily)
MTLTNNILLFEGKAPQLDSSVWVDPTALIIGDVIIGANSSVWPMAVIRGDIHSICIGSGTNIQDGAILHVTHDGQFVPGGFPLILGDEIIVGHHAVLHGCNIGNHCLIGIGARILDGAVIEPYTQIGAGALVSPGKHLPSGYLWIGTPARQARALTDKEREHIEYSANYYKKLAERYKCNSNSTA